MTSFNQSLKKTHGKKSKYKNSKVKKVLDKNLMKNKGINLYFASQKSGMIKQNEFVKKDSSHLNYSDRKVNQIQDCLLLNADDTLEGTTSVGYLNMSPHGSKKLLMPDSNSGNSETSIPINPLLNENNIGLTPSKKSKQSIKQSDNKKITEFYPIRRSSRKPKSVIKKENEDKLIDAVLSNQENGLEVVQFENKGRGVQAVRKFCRNEFVVEYAGDLVSWSEAKKREKFYACNPTIGCYMYYFSARSQNYCIDATAESGRLGRLLNHSRKNPSCYTKLVWIPNPTSRVLEPRLVILARRDVVKGEELTYDYGDRDKDSLRIHPWLKS